MRTCPACQQTNTDQAAFCIECGAHLPMSSEPDAAREPASPGTVPAAPRTGAMKASAPSLSGPLDAGALVDRKYEVEGVLGEGGMGIVYVARDIHTQMRVVIKAIRAEYAHRQDFRDRILAEGRALAHIDHVNVVHLNAVVVESDALYLVMQFIEGEALDKVIERHAAQRTPVPVLEALRIFRQVLEGVAAAHREGVIHRDLKPANILIRARDGVAKVTDFGIAKPEEDAKAGRGQTKGIIGSLLYMAPEQVTGRRDLDKRVDIYGLGILLWEMLVGRVPFDAPSEFEIMKLHLEAQLPSVCAVRPDVPPFLDAVIQKACAKERDQRFSSAEQFIAAIDAGMAQAMSTGVQAVVHPTGLAMMASRLAPGGDPAAAEPMAPMVPATLTAEAVPLRESVYAGTAPGTVGPLEEPRSRAGLWTGVVLAVVVLGAGAALGTAYAEGWIELPERLSPDRRAGADAGADVGADSAGADAQADAQSQSPLAALVGPWKSDGGRLYDAVLAGNVLEFRIRDATGLRELGYIDTEARFSITATAGERNVFNVEDKWRPELPSDLRYDLPRSRTTCQQIWSSVDGRPLRGQFDGRRLTLDAVKVDPQRSMFVTKGSLVTGCNALRNAKVTRIESVLMRP